MEIQQPASTCSSRLPLSRPFLSLSRSLLLPLLPDLCVGQIKDFADVPPGEDFADVPPDEDELLKAVAQQPMSVGIAASGREFQSYTSGVFNGDCGEELDHAVVVVGYGATEDGTKFWKIWNSWGETWGEGGYMMIERGTGSSKGTCRLASQASYPIA